MTVPRRNRDTLVQTIDVLASVTMKMDDPLF